MRSLKTKNGINQACLVEKGPKYLTKYAALGVCSSKWYTKNLYSAYFKKKNIMISDYVQFESYGIET